MDVNESEKEILEYWDKEKIYNRVKDKNKNGPKFYFMDGPPYATGYIHLGTALNKTLKDISMRARRSQGFDVFDRPGYDTHGVPIEFKIEKEIGSTSKKDIEKYGVQKFVDRCKEFSTQFIDVMNKDFRNLGIWMDWDNPYLTFQDDYIEAVWSVFKAAEEKKLLYLGKYPVHVCSRCETAVAYNEIEYGKQKDESIFVKFPLKHKKDTYLIIWTTTPWTLPANTGIMVNPGVTYQEVEIAEGEKWIVAKDLVESLMTKLERGFTVKSEYSGSEMSGWEYENPLSKKLDVNLNNAYKVVLSSRYVTTEEGTGLVHCAPGHGKEDFEVGKENGLDIFCPVGTDGILTEEAGKYSGKRARIVDKEIIEDLEKDGFLVYKMRFEHDYPLCWRCKTPLLMVSVPQWFLKISEIKERLIEKNEEVNWVPPYMKLRMKAWLEGIGDWPVSRQRYWGTPLPIWICEETGERIVVGTVKELSDLSGADVKDLHKPGIDEIVIEKNGKKFKRVNEVLDVWFDSGVSSWAALGYPSRKDLFDKFWPADFNLEGTDQFRGWWNSQIILSEIMFDKKPFESIEVHGMVLDLGKKKMSKSEGNFVSPQSVIEKYGRDLMRYYFAKMSRGEDISYKEEDFKDIGKIIRILDNVCLFNQQVENVNNKNKIEDSWIISRLNSVIRDVTEKYNSYKFYEVINIIEGFLMEEVSRNYIQTIRNRSGEAKKVLEEVINKLLILYSPIIPFMTDRKWKELGNKESIHLSDWPTVEKDKIDLDLEKSFISLRKVIEAGLRERDKRQIGLKWPLAKALVRTDNVLSEELLEIVKEQLNVKEVDISLSENENEVEYDLTMTDELEGEGFAREIARRVQAERKNLGMQKKDTIELRISISAELKNKIKSNKELIKERTGSNSVDFTEDMFDHVVDFKVKEELIKFSLK